MSTSPREGGGLRAVRLSEIPIELRLRAAGTVSRAQDTTPARVEPADRLFARLLSDRQAQGDSTEVERLRAVALNPSAKTYWVSRAAYERVMLPKNRRTP